MCGIAGIYLSDSNSIEPKIRSLVDSIRRRGPDAEGIWISTDRRVAFGHRRLSILDLSAAGAQPMASASGRYHIVLNGEIYNYASLRSRLSHLTLRGHSDTEVFINLVETLGLDETLRICEGMFAFGIYDTVENKIYLGRDRVGEKPLFYFYDGEVLGFSSQLNSLLPLLKEEPKINISTLSHYLNFGFSKRMESLVQGIKKVEPATYSSINLHKKELQTHRYWQYIKSPTSFDKKISSPLDTLDQLLMDVVSAEVSSSDVPLGSFLSGGIDSSLITSYAQKTYGKKIKTFSIGFHEEKWNEAPWAKKIANYLQTEHHEEYFSEVDLLEQVESLPIVYDEPLGDPSQLPTLLLASFARKHVTVALSGDGGDELFGGYDRYQRFLVARTIRDLSMPKSLVKIAANLVYGSTRSQTLMTALNTNSDLQLYESFQAAAKGDVPLISHHVEHLGFPEEQSSRKTLEDLMAIDFHTYLPDDIMVKVDKATMYYGLEARAPFLNHKVVEFSNRLPLDLKITNRNKKIILKKLLSRHIPEELFNRPKKGFGVPLDQWLRGPLRSWASDLINTEMKAETLLDREKIQLWWGLHQSEKYNYSGRLWNLLMFLQWKRHYRIT